MPGSALWAAPACCFPRSMYFRPFPSDVRGMNKHLFGSLAIVCVFATTGYLGAQQDPASGGRKELVCRSCGVIASIRELQQDRASASTLTQRLPPVGPVFGFTFGGDAPVKGFVGAV